MWAAEPVAEPARIPKPERWRLFVAVDLPDSIEKTLEAPLRSLDGLESTVRRSPLSGIHLTLAFLGMVDVSRLDATSAALGAATSGIGRFSVEVGGSGVFPSPSRPQVLWIGIGGQGKSRLVELAAAVSTHLRQAGFDLEQRPFHPHLTLGRLRGRPRPRDLQPLRRWLDDWRDRPLGTVEISAVNLMRSQLSKGSPTYTRLQTFGLE